jgi:ankyrin repeat protein
MKILSDCFLESGADPLEMNNDMDTCLHWAAEDGNLNMLRMLAGNLVPTDLKNKFGHTGLMKAACSTEK